MIKLGHKVKDIITGYKGTVIGRAEYVTGCVQLCVVPPVDKDGKPQDANWIDEVRLEDLGASFVPHAAAVAANPAGPQRNAPSCR